MLLRALRRKTSLEVTSVDQLLQLEFVRDGRPDLEVSVYEVEDGEITQATAEHAASFLANPGTRTGLVVDQPDSADLIADKGKTEFRFTQDRHRSIVFFDEDELRAMLAGVFPAAAKRSRTCTRSDLGKYVADCLVVLDPEWLSLCGRPDRSSWRTLGETFRSRQTQEVVSQPQQAAISDDDDERPATLERSTNQGLERRHSCLGDAVKCPFRTR